MVVELPAWLSSLKHGCRASSMVVELPAWLSCFQHGCRDSSMVLELPAWLSRFQHGCRASIMVVEHSIPTFSATLPNFYGSALRVDSARLQNKGGSCYSCGVTTVCLLPLWSSITHLYSHSHIFLSHFTLLFLTHTSISFIPHFSHFLPHSSSSTSLPHHLPTPPLGLDVSSLIISLPLSSILQSYPRTIITLKIRRNSWVKLLSNGIRIYHNFPCRSRAQVILSSII